MVAAVTSCPTWPMHHQAPHPGSCCSLLAPKYPLLPLLVPFEPFAHKQSGKEGGSARLGGKEDQPVPPGACPCFLSFPTTCEDGITTLPQTDPLKKSFTQFCPMQKQHHTGTHKKKCLKHTQKCPTQRSISQVYSTCKEAP